jgi:hypothetical protein
MDSLGFVVLLCLAVCSGCAKDGLQSMQEQVRMCPQVPDFTQYFDRVPNLGRRLRIAAPCVGVHGCGHALHDMMQVPSDTINVYDLDEAYLPALVTHLRQAGMENILVNLGKVAGDILKVPLGMLQVPVDFLVAGPPCPPWAAQGNKKGMKDVRAKARARNSKTGMLLEDLETNMTQYEISLNAKDHFPGTPFGKVRRLKFTQVGQHLARKSGVSEIGRK